MTDNNSVLLDKAEVLIYLNPTESEIIMRWKNRYRNRLNIILYNTLGGVVKDLLTNSDVNEFRFDLKGISRGIYIFEMKDMKNNLVLNRSRIKKG